MLNFWGGQKIMKRFGDPMDDGFSLGQQFMEVYGLC